MKRMLSVFLSVLFLLTAIPLGAVSVSAATYGDLTYTISGGKVTITDCKTTASGALTIPYYIAGYPVTAIGSGAFEDCTSLTSVTIPSSITAIGNRAFEDCDSLTSVTIPSSVTAIGNWAFYNCTSLTKVTIPDSVTTIGYRVFCLCFSLMSVTIPDGITTIGEGVFFGCRSLTTMTIPDSVTTIGDSAFYACNSLMSVTIPDSVTTIGNQAFYACNSLTSMTIPDGVTTIEWGAFGNCSSLTSVTIPDSVTSIDNYAFQSCTSLTDIHYSGTEVDKANILIGGGNSYLLDAAWHYANGNVSGKCGDNATWIYYEDEEKLVISGTGTVSGDWRSYAPCYVIIEEGITGVGDTYFASTYGDVCVLVIPSTLTSVGNESFMCGARTVILNSAIIAANASTYDSVGYLFFHNTTTLVNASISKKGSYISGSYTESVTVNGTAYRMYSDCEHGYIKVTSDDFSGAQCAYCYMPKDVFADAGNFIYTLSNGKIIITGVYESVSELIIPATIGGYPVTTIGGWAFSDNTSLTTVTIPNTVTTIKNYAFYGSDSLTDVYYFGTQENCAAMNIAGYGNDYLLNATWHYVCEHEYVDACDEQCNICGEYRKASHNIIHVEAKPLTCSQNGNIEYWYCDNCYVYYADEDCTMITNAMSVILPATHNVIRVAAVAPTCFEPGNIEYWYCENCDVYYADEACTVIINAKSVILPVTHNVIHVEAVAPTCYENGNIEYWYCTECGYAWLDKDCTLNTNLKAVILPVTHSYSDGCHNYRCTICGDVIKYNHVQHIEAVAPICFVPGNVEYWYCEMCGMYFLDEACTEIVEYRETILPAHNIVHVEAKAPTCTELGNIEYWYCTECGYAWLDEDCTLNTNLKAVILPVTHSYSDGCHNYRCTICGDVIKYNHVQHIEAVAPICFVPGNVEYWYCEMCGMYFLDEACTEIVEYRETILPAHNIVHVEAKAPTCTELGNIEYWYCTECGYAWLDEDCTLNTNLKAVILPTLDHIYDDEYDACCNVCGGDREVPEKPSGVLVYGDADGDGKVTLMDAAVLQQFLAGWDATLYVETADADGDGKVTLMDAALLQQYLAGWDVRLGEQSI